MIAIIATFEVQPGREAAFEAACRTLVEQVRAQEPGALLYQLVRAKKAPLTYRMMELYADKEALKLHGGTSYFQTGIEAIKATLTCDPVIEVHDAID